jgi:hypothetical protein
MTTTIERYNSNVNNYRFERLRIFVERDLLLTRDISFSRSFKTPP